MHFFKPQFQRFRLYSNGVHVEVIVTIPSQWMMFYWRSGGVFEVFHKCRLITKIDLFCFCLRQGVVDVFFLKKKLFPYKP